MEISEPIVQAGLIRLPRHAIYPRCCGSQWKRVRLAIEHSHRPTIIDSTQGVRLTLMATKPTPMATDQWQVLPTLYGEFFGR
jgi:hypothetical protein